MLAFADSQHLLGGDTWSWSDDGDRGPSVNGRTDISLGEAAVLKETAWAGLEPETRGGGAGLF